MPALLDRFIIRADERRRHEITIRAPAALVMAAARNFDLQSIRTIRAIFWLRSKILGARPAPPRPPQGLVADMLDLGWRCLGEEPDRYFVAGAICQPWRPDVVFYGVKPEQFADYAEPDRVKIAWTLEVEALGPSLTRFATETRVAATDDVARKEFRRYWHMFGIGIVAIRRLLLPALRRRAEQAWRSGRPPDAMAE